ncbi:hypothetical protein [Metakosakonia massiliensis]|nr:hypothetical protein [Phytobacter massiliensis]
MMDSSGVGVFISDYQAALIKREEQAERDRTQIKKGSFDIKTAQKERLNV